MHFVDGLIRVAYADEHARADHNEMLSVVWDLIQKYNCTKVLIDASAPSFIRALVEPVAFGVEHKALLYHVK